MRLRTCLSDYEVNAPQSLAGWRDIAMRRVFNPYAARVRPSHERRGESASLGFAMQLSTLVARMNARKMFTKFHRTWVMIGGPAVLFLDLDANACGGPLVPTVRLRWPPSMGSLQQ